MDNRLRTVSVVLALALTVSIAIGLGLLIGYLIWGPSQTPVPPTMRAPSVRSPQSPSLAPTQPAGTITGLSIKAPTYVDAGEIFEVTVHVEPNTAITRIQFDLIFDPTKVSASSVAEGDLLKQSGAHTFFSPGSIDQTGGKISGVAGVILGTGQAMSTGGTFATIILRAGTEAGTCRLALANVVVSPLNAESLMIVTVGSQVSIR